MRNFLKSKIEHETYIKVKILFRKWEYFLRNIISWDYFLNERYNNTYMSIPYFSDIHVQYVQYIHTTIMF